MSKTRNHLGRLVMSLALTAAALAGCDDAPTTAVVENRLAMTTVFKLWWATTLFAEPVPAGATSETERTVAANDFAYALAAPGWSPADGGRPSRLVALRSAAKLSVAVHGVLRVIVSDDTFTGDCALGNPLGAAEVQEIVERIFPGDFAGVTYDPATCTATPVASDGGATEAAAD